MNTVPIFPVKSSLHLPRPDRLPWRTLFALKRTVDEAVPQWIAALADSYGLSLTGPVQKIETPGRSETWLLSTSDGKRILKSYKASVEREHILHEHSILSRLAELQFAAPRLKATTYGETLFVTGKGCYALFDYLDGYFHYHQHIFFPSQAKEFLQAAAAALASLHNSLRDFTPVGKNPNGFQSRLGQRWRSQEWYLEQFGANQRDTHDRLRVQNHPLLRKFIELSDRIEKRLTLLGAILEQAPLERVIIHGDYGPYNLLLKQGSPVVIIDFELARLDWRLTDLAASMNTFARNRLGFQPNKMRQFVQAYQSSAAVSTEELDYLPLVWEYLSLRRMIVCWRRALDTGKENWLEEAQERLQIVDWITRHENILLTLQAR